MRARYGDSTTTSSVAPPTAGQRSRIASAASGSLRDVDGDGVVADRVGERDRLARRPVEPGDRHDHDRPRGDLLLVRESGPARAPCPCPVVAVDRRAGAPSGAGPARSPATSPGRSCWCPTTSATTAVVRAPSPLIARPRPPAGLVAPPPAHQHAGLGQGEGDEHAERVERNQAADAGVESDEQADRHSESATMPVVKASRSPRKANWRGRNPSRARNEERRGKSAKLVLAARTRIRAVAIWAMTRTAPSPVRCRTRR